MSFNVFVYCFFNGKTYRHQYIINDIIFCGDYMKKFVITLVCTLIVGIASYFGIDLSNNENIQNKDTIHSYNIGEIPKYNGKDYVYINNNEPNFTKEDLNNKTKEYYSDLDSLGRCGVVYAFISKDTMPTEKRGPIGMVKPSGWHTVKYDIVDGKYLYNRCHLIGYQLTGQNANVKNLITCTRHTNAQTMLEFENKVAQFVRDGGTVLYRVTPIFEGNNLLASGIQIEALSTNDNGKGIKFNVYIYNVQDGINIDYKTGDSALK